MKKNFLHVLGRSHALEILESPNYNNMRFADLRDISRSNRTRSARLRELSNEGLIRAVPKSIGNMAYTFYETTTLGIDALSLGKKLFQLQGKEKRK